MTRDEQKAITGFIEQAVDPHSNARNTPMDVEADAIIRALFVRGHRAGAPAPPMPGGRTVPGGGAGAAVAPATG